MGMGGVYGVDASGFEIGGCGFADAAVACGGVDDVEEAEDDEDDSDDDAEDFEGGVDGGYFVEAGAEGHGVRGGVEVIVGLFSSGVSSQAGGGRTGYRKDQLPL